MPRRERSIGQEIQERIAAGDVADEEAARVAVAHDIATRRLGYRCHFEEATYVGPKRLEFGIELQFKFEPVHRKPGYAWNLWHQIRAGKLDGAPVKFSPDNETITAGNHRITDIVVWNRAETTAVSTAKRVAPVRRGFPANEVAGNTAPATQSLGSPASPKRHPGDTDRDRGELLYQAAKPHTGSLSWLADTAFGAAQKKFPDNPLLVEMSSRAKRRAWLYAKQKLREEA